MVMASSQSDFSGVSSALGIPFIQLFSVSDLKSVIDIISSRLTPPAPPQQMPPPPELLSLPEEASASSQVCAGVMKLPWGT